MNPRVGRYASPRQAAEMEQVYSDVVAVLAPSHYEPFSLVTGEALAAGVPVVASDQIGAAEGVEPAVCRIFPAGDIDAFEREVRALLDELRDPQTVQALAAQARDEARRLFSADRVGDILLEIVQEVSGVRVAGQPSPAAETASTARR
jgi:glycosyltransferase involved in cell wall biosynthesis